MSDHDIDTTLDELEEQMPETMVVDDHLIIPMLVAVGVEHIEDGVQWRDEFHPNALPGSRVQAAFVATMEEEEGGEGGDGEEDD